MSVHPKAGTIGWIDLTVPDAARVRDFYAAVVGWTHSNVQMDDYADYCVHPRDGAEPIAGICHARGANANVPPQWLIYINVDNLDESLVKCRERGGDVIEDPREVGGMGRMAVIRDPAGAVCALFEPAE